MPEDTVPPHQIVLTTLQNAPLKTIFVVHFILITWGIQGYWSPDSYFFYNFFFFLTLFWSMYDKESEEPIILCLVIDMLAIPFDVIVLSAYYPSWSSGSGDKFSVAMAIINLVLRPVSCFILHKHFLSRSAVVGPSGVGVRGFFSGNTSREPKNYQDMEAGHQSAPTFHPSSPPSYH